MSRFLKVTLIAGLCLLATPVALRAYLLNPTSFMATNVVNTFFVSNTITQRMSFLPAAPQPVTLGQVIGTADRVVQAFNRTARVQTALAISSDQNYTQTITNCPGACQNGGPEASISVRDRYFGQGTVTAQSLCTGSYATNCDIIFFTNDQWTFDTDALDGTGAVTVGPRWSAVLQHEFGHTYGMADLPPWACDLSSDYAPLMCQSSYSGYNTATRRWQWPSPDEVDGATGYYATATRQIGLIRVDVPNASSFTTSNGAMNPNLAVASSRTPPRVSCQETENPPDCVIATTDAGHNITLWAITDFGVDWASSAPGPVTVPGSHRSSHEVDVAFGNNSTVVAAFLKYDGTNTAKHGWAQWNLATNTISLGQFAGDGRQPPRVSWHKGWQRYVYAALNPQRQLTISTSTNAAGTSWSAPVVVTPNIVAYGSFDVSCPTHGLGSCEVIFHSPAGLPGDRKTALRSCKFDILMPLPTVSNVTCVVTDLESRSATSLSDMRIGPTGLGGAGWFMSGAALFAAEGANHRLALTSGEPVFFQIGNKLDVFSPFGAAPGSQSAWGGGSCDYAEWGKRILCVELRGAFRW